MQPPGSLQRQALEADSVKAEPAIAAIVAQAPYADVQRVGQKFWDAAAALGKIVVNGNPDGTDLQTLLDNWRGRYHRPRGQ